VADHADTLDEQALRRLLPAARAIVSGLELEAVLERVLDAAADVTSARFAALGVLDARRQRRERLLTRGVEAATETVLDVPIPIRGETWGDLHLAGKPGGFTHADERAAVVLAEWAGVGIDNARLYAAAERRQEDLERAVRRLEATTAIALAVGADRDLDDVLALIADHARELAGAPGAVIMLRDEGGLVVAAARGDVPAQLHGARFDGDVARASFELLGADPLLVTLVFRGRSLGLLAVLGAGADRATEALLRTFAVSAATAVATARTVEEQRLHVTIAAAEAERVRWAHELHDQPLQALAALRLVLVNARRAGDPDELRTAVTAAIECLDGDIAGLRELVRELRPAALDELGLPAAIEGLADRVSARAGLDVQADVRLGERRLPGDMETAIYRIVQEALTNVVRHASAARAEIAVARRAGAVRVDVRDDGHGFDPEDAASGYGLTGMRERAAMFHGDLEIASSASGTHVALALPEREYRPVTRVAAGGTSPRRTR
jgi:signal transduction histidine kinase